jgi:hypothetical protein
MRRAGSWLRQGNVRCRRTRSAPVRQTRRTALPRGTREPVGAAPASCPADSASSTIVVGARDQLAGIGRSERQHLSDPAVGVLERFSQRICRSFKWAQPLDQELRACSAASASSGLVAGSWSGVVASVMSSIQGVTLISRRWWAVCRTLIATRMVAVERNARGLWM